MTLVQLANFVRIAELQSLSKAAAVIRIAQPALSRQVRTLETDLGAPLLIRHAWGVSLTEAGELLLDRARRLLNDAENARDAVRALSAQPGGRIAIGVPTSVSTTLAPPLASILRAKYADLRPHFVDGFSAVLHARALAGELDLAVLYEDRAIGPLVTTPLLAEDLMLVGPANGTCDPTLDSAELLARARLILPGRPNRLRLIVDEALARNPEPHGDISEVASLPAIIAMVANGSGYTVLPYSTVAEDVARGDLTVWELAAPQLSRTLLLARPLSRNATAATAAVEEEIHAVVAALRTPMRWRVPTQP